MLALGETWRAVSHAVRHFLTGGSIADVADRRPQGRMRRDRLDDGLDREAATHRNEFHEVLTQFRTRLRVDREYEKVMQEAIRNERRARRRSLTLLLKILSPEQRQEFHDCRYFHVTGGATGTRYRIRVAQFGNIDVLRSGGKVKHRLCAHPRGIGIPLYDMLAAQMLHLQDPATEREFIREANIH